MRTIILSFLLLFCVAVENINSQVTVKPAFLSVSNKYEFTLPQFDVSLPLPANTQFLVPHFSGKNIKLEIDDVTCYYFDLSYLEKPNSLVFYFNLPALKDNENLLSMMIMNLNESELKQRLGNASSRGDWEMIPGLKTKLGKSTSYLSTKPDGDIAECHAISKGEYTYFFALNDNMDKKLKKQYLNIIKNFKEKNQPYLKVRYETRVQNGEFEPKEEKETKVPVKAPEQKGTLTASSFFEWPTLGYGIQIPQGWEYQVEGNPVSEKENHMQLSFDKSFFEDNFMTMSWFRSEELSVTIRSYREIDLPNMIKSQAANTKYTQDVDIIINGIPFQACYYGSKEYGSLDFSFEAEGKYHWVSFSGVSKNTLAQLQEMLSTIKLKNDLPKQTKIFSKDLSSQLNLKELTPLILDQPLSLNENWPEGDLFNCELVDLDIVAKLPGKEGDYMSNIGDLKGKVNNGIIKGVPENSTDKRLAVYSINRLPVTLAISKKEQTIPNEKYILYFKRGWSIYKNAELIHGSISTINGLEWCVCIMRNDALYFSMCTCYVGDYEIMVSTNVKSKEDAFKSVNYLKNVFYKPLF